MRSKRRAGSVQSVTGVTEEPSRTLPQIIPPGSLLVTGMLALGLGLFASEWVGVGLVVFAVCASTLVVVWARARSDGDILVTAVALLLFWMPFQITQTRFNLSLQEVGVYGICLMCAFFDRRGIWRWMRELLTTTSSFMRLALLIFVLACAQSLIRVTQFDLVASVNSLHSIVVYPVLFGLLVAYTMRSRKAMTLLLKAFLAGGAAFAAFALALKFWGVDFSNGAVAGRLGAESSFLSLYHPNNLALYLVLALAFVPGVIGDAIRSRRLTAFKVAGILVTTGVMTLAIWLTYSRGALAALLLGMVVVLLTVALWGNGLLQDAAIGILAIGIGLIAVLIWFDATALLGRFGSLLDPLDLLSDPNVLFRIRLYVRAVQIASEQPITGIGLQQFASTGSVPFSPHSTYLDLLVGTGVFGLLAFATILLLGLGAACAGIRAFNKNTKARQVVDMLYAIGFIIALVAFIAQAFVETFDANIRIAPVVFMLAFCADGALRVRSRKRQQNSQVENTPTQQATSEQPADVAQPMTRAQSDTAPSSPTPPQPQANLRSVVLVGDTEEHRDPPAAPKRPFTRADWGGWGEWDDWSDDPLAAAVWRQQTTVLPAWHFQTGDIDQWKVDSAQLPAIGRSSRSSGRYRTPGAPQHSQPRSHDAGVTEATGSQAGEEMLQRAPTSFIWNQLYALWYFATGFLLSIVITRGLSRDNYGVYAILTTVITTITFIAAIGLEDAATVFLARIHTRDGPRATGALVRRLLLTRVLVICVAGLGLAVGLMVAVPFFIHLGVTPAFFDDMTGGSGVARAGIISVYLVGASVSALQIAFFAALLRSRVVLIIGGLSQVVSVVGVFVLLKIGWGIDGVFAAQAVAAWLSVFAYLIPLRTLLFARGKIRSVQRGEMRKFMVGAWLTNISNTALGKQMDIMIMTAFAIGTAAIGYYNLAYQLGSIIGVVLISGLGGVGMAAMSAALSTGGPQRLASMWRANIMVQVILAVPLQIVCFAFADQIVTVLYGSNYAGAALLLRIFLAFSIVGRVIGGGASQSALYVVGKQRSIVVLRWSGLIINVILDIVLIQYLGPVGAMVATGFSQVWVGLMEYFLLRMHLGTVYPLTFVARVASVALFASLLLLWWAPSGFIGLIAIFSLFGVLFLLGLRLTNSGDTDTEDLTELMLANSKLKAIAARLSRFVPRSRTATASA